MVENEVWILGMGLQLVLTQQQPKGVRFKKRKLPEDTDKNQQQMTI